MKIVQEINETQDNTLSSISKTVLLRHLSSFKNNDLQAVVSDYTNESILITQDAIYKGPSEIKVFFASLIKQFPKQSSSFELDKVIVDDELVYIVWHGKTPSLDVPFATDTFIIKNGKILRQTFAGQLEFIN
jgi:predicted SnoaL-like aldol condensation-catalyzing enzyme